MTRTNWFWLICTMAILGSACQPAPADRVANELATFFSGEFSRIEPGGAVFITNTDLLIGSQKNPSPPKHYLTRGRFRKRLCRM